MFIPFNVDPDLQGEVNKRLSLNLLIQGAACHTFVTAHHLVRNELNQLQTSLVEEYDRFATSLMMMQWMSPDFFVDELPLQFWTQSNEEDWLFANHRFLVKHGLLLATDAYEEVYQRAIKHETCVTPELYRFEIMEMMSVFAEIEQRFKPELEAFSVDIVSRIWGIHEDMLSAELTFSPAFGNIREPATEHGQLILGHAIGWGGVEQVGDDFTVIAKAWFWPLVTHELVKGTAELVCLHGLSNLDEPTYQAIVDAADHIEFESG